MTHKASAVANNQLPEWDLSDLYPSPESSRLKDDIATAFEAAKTFEKHYSSTLHELNGAVFGAALIEYERIGDILGRIMSYAQLLYAADVSDPERGRFYQGMQERVTEISSHTLFFTLEINRLDDATLERLLAAPEAQRYAPWLRDIRVFREHQLSDELEKMLHDLHVVGTAAWHRLFDETMARLRFPIGGRDLTSAEALNLLSDTDGAKRKEAAKSLGRVLGENAPLFALITNTLTKEKEIDDRWRHYPRPQSFRNLSNQVEDHVVDALAAAVKDCYGELAHRYYALKAKWFGVEMLDYWDRNAPLPDDDDRLYSWDEARDIVLGAYGAFSPEMEALGRRFFDNNWIDAPTRPGKSPGAFAHPTVPSVHPYLLVNFMGRTRDVMTLAHELGHGVHQILAGSQGGLMSDTPLTLAETASVFGEMLTFRALLEREIDPRRRRIMLAGKVEDMLNTVVRQIAFYDFESLVHEERRQGELSPERIGELWMQVQTDSLGPTFRFDEEYKNYWTYIPHFIHSPFYVYAYAFGDCLVNSLYSAHAGGTVPSFPDRYLDMLRAGGTLRHGDLLAPFGLDAANPDFWRQGLDVVIGFIDELERM
ncbi:M3 family oligoendopeptidase [Magnetospirillum molischianum]|uniref:Putative oligoendopeptidase F n=1 Tax=Magnetospirillum molischianum DSM 120 TaxID=1150626 RepID=H8FN92_MAGML|nr:M3 family oligoendopeptidase [Magnetospirillum molischianum]CCG39830.1 putative oligoendopeptidase F [Magnetospirillum molischianum DSM 120]